MRQFVNNLNIVDSINIRDAYYGSRTNALCLYKKFTDPEKGHYVDFRSLYPDVLKYQKFPVGHPEKIIRNFKPVDYIYCTDETCVYRHANNFHIRFPYFGIVKAKFLPPKNLIHPILPVRCNGKLKFPLCKNCAEKDLTEKCSCTDENRSFTETYCSGEVELALNFCYKIVTLYEVLHWNEYDKYDSTEEQGGIFTNYINAFLKIKQEASGIPEGTINILKYIEEYKNHESILLLEENIKKNPGLRGVSKLALNSFYGKFGQRTNIRKTKVIKDVGSLYNIMTDKSKDVCDFPVMNDDVMEIEFKNSSDFEPISQKTNPVIAAFCTSWARIKLWNTMYELGDRVLYHDTDSVIFSSTPDDTMPALGNYLGQLTDELSCKNIGCKEDNCTGHWIEEFISCGPKNYAYKPTQEK